MNLPRITPLAAPTNGVNAALLRLALATGLASVGLAAGGTGGALLATELAGTEAVAGIPFGLVVIGSAAGAVLLSQLTTRIGRARALAAGYLVGVAGAVLVIGAAMVESVALVLAGSLLLGPANAAVFLARYAGADLADEVRRGRAMGTVLFAAALGAILAPNLLGPSGAAARAIGLSPYSGLHLVAIAAFGVGAATLFGGGRQTAGRGQPSSSAAGPTPSSASGLLVLGAANAAMVGLMAVAPVHLTHSGHSLEFVGLVISIHVAGMLVPSPLTGWLTDRLGPGLVAAAGAVMLLGAGGWAAIGDQADAWTVTGYLVILGLGWNLAVVSGSTMLTAGLSPAHRPRAEAAGEVAMGIAAGLAAGSAGVVAAAAGWPPLAIGVGLAGVGAALGLRYGTRRDSAPIPSATIR
ncbi:MAG: MFS transporter [Candidatus Limnocylindria bacterium]